MSYKDTVDKGLGIVNKVLVDLIVNELTAVYGDSWWSVCVLGKLKNANSLPRKGDTKSLAGSLDVLSCVYVIRSNKESFDSVLEFKQYKALDDILDARNESAHCGINGMTDRDAMRHLDAMERFCRPIDEGRANELLDMWNKVNANTIVAQPASNNPMDTSKGSSSPDVSSVQCDFNDAIPDETPSVKPEADNDSDMYQSPKSDGTQTSEKKILDEELNDFRNRVLRRAESQAKDNMTSAKEEFTRIVADDVMDAGGAEDFVPCQFNATVRGGRKAEIAGYSLDEYNTISVFISIFNGTPNPEKISGDELEKAAKRAVTFLKEAMSDNIRNYIEYGDPAWDAADAIYREKNNLECVKVHIFTDNVWSSRAKEEYTSEDDTLKIRLCPVDIRKFHDQTLSASEHMDFRVDLSRFKVDGIRYLKASTDDGFSYNSYLCVVPGQLLSDLFGAYRNDLLESNVRSYLGRKKNLYIKGTIKDAPDMFFAYNNGITATATDVGVEEVNGVQMITSIQSLQIVNGGQTTVTIFDADKVDGKDLSKVYVMMKLIEVPLEKQGAIVPKISRAANTQLKVQEQDFDSGHPFHKKMNELSTKTAPTMPGRTRTSFWFYESTRGQYETKCLGLKSSDKSNFEMQFPADQRITKTQMAQYRIWYEGFPPSIERSPYTDRANVAFNNFMKGVKARYKADPAFVNSIYYKESIGLAILFKNLLPLLSGQNWSKRFKPQLTRYTIARVAVMLEEKGLELDLMKFWEYQAIPPELCSPLVKAGHAVWLTLDSGIKDKETLDPAYWLRSPECWNKVKETDISYLIGDFAGYTISKSDHEKRLKDANNSESKTILKEAREWANKIGPVIWKKAVRWAEANEGAVEDSDLNLLRKAAEKLPAGRECVSLKRIIEDLEAKGFDKTSN